MATTQDELVLIGNSTGNTTYCTRCGENLECTGGTDPDKTDELGGFKEQYRCPSCGGSGELTFRYADDARAYSGVCAGEHMWE